VGKAARPDRSRRDALPADVLHDVPFAGGHARRRNQIDRRRHWAGTHQSGKQGESGLAGSLAAQPAGVSCPIPRCRAISGPTRTCISVTRYIESKLTDPSLLSDVPKLEAPAPDEIQLGRRLFAEKGCSSCHVIKGLAPQTDFGPDLASLGSKNRFATGIRQLEDPRTPVAYIEAKITDPVSVNVAARMPQYSLAPGDLDALTTALLSMTGKSARRAWKA
jgi:mono/diheme cytochrome c family protein